jgi:uncharacterized membrane protein YsdA (DUF1294 family)
VSIRVRLWLLFPLAFLVAIAVAACARAIPAWIGLAYLGASFVTPFVYWRDKVKAQRGGWRISESTLHWLELLGGWPGALLAQRMLRHKNHKASFQIFFWLIVAAHLAVWVWILWPSRALHQS